MSDQPKPASGEWTAKPSQTHGWYIEFDRGNGASIGNELTAKGIVNAHNAALAASLADQPLFRKTTEANIKLLEQLAAEREKYSEWHQQALINAGKVRTLVAALREVNALARGNMTGCGTCNHVIAATIKAIPKDEENWIRAEDNPGYNRHE